MRNTPAQIAASLLLFGISVTNAAHLGQSEESVLQEHGEPKSTLSGGGTRILIYTEGRIKLDQGKVIEISGNLAPTDPTQQSTKPATLPKEQMPTKSAEPAPVPSHLQPVVNELVDSRHMQTSNPGLEKQRYLLLYYADGKSKASARITPQLIYYYNRFKSGNNFDVLFVSADTSPRRMTNHMSKASMPWPAIRYQSIEASGLLKYRGNILPAMALLDADGQLIASSEVDGKYKGCGAVLDALSKRL